MISGLTSSSWGSRLSQASAAATALPTQIASNLAFVGFMTNSGTHVDTTTVACLSLPSLITVTLGAKLAGTLSDSALKLVFGSAMVALSPYFFSKAIRNQGPKTAAVKGVAVRETHHGSSYSTHTAAGAAMGFATGIVGVGAGPIVMSYLSMFSTELSQAEIVLTTNCAIVPTFIAGCISHSRAGNVNWRLAGPLSLASMAGGVCGGAAATHAPEALLQGLFSSFLFVFGASTVRKAWLKMR